jgi:hypothetical protein
MVPPDGGGSVARRPTDPGRPLRGARTRDRDPSLTPGLLGDVVPERHREDRTAVDCTEGRDNSVPTRKASTAVRTTSLNLVRQPRDQQLDRRVVETVGWDDEPDTSADLPPGS